MASYSNLISESILINETIELLKTFGGRASAVKVVDYVMKISTPEPDLAILLISDLVNSDPRLQLNHDTVEFIQLHNERRNLFENDYVVFDFETTGAKVPPCRVTEIGAYRVRNGKIIENFHTLINPESPIPMFITQLTGISDQMVAQAPKFRDIANDFLEFIGDAVLVAHNAQFDMRFLNHEIGMIYEGYRIANPYLCTVQLSRRLIPYIENHKLNTVCAHFCISLENHHRALHDAYATAQVFVNLLEDLQNRGVKDLASVKKFRI